MSLKGARRCHALMLGLPSAGKSTYLAALWHVVESEDVPGSLRLKALGRTRKHLNRLRRHWLDGTPLGRTPRASDERTILDLVEDETGRPLELVVPDLSGELFELGVEQRAWSRELDAYAAAADAWLLFMHPNHVIEPTRIDEADQLHRELVDEEPGPELDDGEEVAWEAQLMPTQVKLVELLQLLTSRSDAAGRRKLALIVSAWDLLETKPDTPDVWVAKRLPLLDQYLTANDDIFSVRIYGVSAQGGDLTNDADRLRGMLQPSQRIRVYGPDAALNDITAPIRWLSEENGP